MGKGRRGSGGTPRKAGKIFGILFVFVVLIGIAGAVKFWAWPEFIYPNLPAHMRYRPEIADTLAREDTVTLTSIPECIDYPGESGQGVVINLIDSAPEINKTLAVSGDVCAVKIIGKEGVTYTNFSISISSHEELPLLIELENVAMVGSADMPTIICNSERSLYIKSSGNQNSVIGANATSAVSAAYELYILGDAPLSIIGGGGTDGIDAESGCRDGTAGTDGADALAAERLCVYITDTLTLTGGNGGNGGNGHGYPFSTGYPNYSGHDDREALFDGKDGGNGDDGGNGGNGGAGGRAYDVSTIYIDSGKVIATAGNSGNGGNGADGGKGGKGQESGGWGSRAGNGGKGGDGGDGGDTYSVRASDGEEKNYYGNGELLLISGASGTPGNAGYGGSGGPKGMHCDNENCGQWLTSGSDGHDGVDGVDGDAGRVIKK